MSYTSYLDTPKIHGNDSLKDMLGDLTNEVETQKDPDLEKAHSFLKEYGYTIKKINNGGYHIQHTETGKNISVGKEGVTNERLENIQVKRLGGKEYLIVQPFEPRNTKAYRILLFTADGGIEQGDEIYNIDKAIPFKEGENDFLIGYGEKKERFVYSLKTGERISGAFNRPISE